MTYSDSNILLDDYILRAGTWDEIPQEQITGKIGRHQAEFPQAQVVATVRYPIPAHQREQRKYKYHAYREEHPERWVAPISDSDTDMCVHKGEMAFYIETDDGDMNLAPLGEEGSSFVYTNNNGIPPDVSLRFAGVVGSCHHIESGYRDDFGALIVAGQVEITNNGPVSLKGWEGCVLLMSNLPYAVKTQQGHKPGILVQGEGPNKYRPCVFPMRQGYAPDLLRALARVARAKVESRTSKTTGDEYDSIYQGIRQDRLITFPDDVPIHQYVRLHVLFALIQNHNNQSAIKEKVFHELKKILENNADKRKRYNVSVDDQHAAYQHPMLRETLAAWKADSEWLKKMTYWLQEEISNSEHDFLGYIRSHAIGKLVKGDNRGEQITVLLGYFHN